MSLYIAGLWRYPVKSLAGERVSSDHACGRTAWPATESFTCAARRAFAHRGASTGFSGCAGRSIARPPADQRPSMGQRRGARTRQKGCGRRRLARGVRGTRSVRRPAVARRHRRCRRRIRTRRPPPASEHRHRRRRGAGRTRVAEAPNCTSAMPSSGSTRCAHDVAMTTVDPDTLRVDPGGPSRHRPSIREQAGPERGHRRSGTIRVGDSVELLTK